VNISEENATDNNRQGTNRNFSYLKKKLTIQMSEDDLIL